MFNDGLQFLYRKRFTYRIAKLIHSELKKRPPIIKLQSPLDDATELKGFRIMSEDDHILKCCLSIKNNIGEC